MPGRRWRTKDVSVKDASGLKDDGLASSLDRFAEDTSMLGFRYLHTKYETWFR